MLNIDVLGSSSKGNSYIIRTSQEVLIIEAGVTYKQIAKSLDFNFDNVVGCLVSHGHKDHSKSVKDLVEHGVDVFCTAGTVSEIKLQHHRITVIESEKQFKLGSFTILPFKTMHDSIEPVGFIVYHKDFGKLLFATDTYYIEYKFKGLNYIMVECNYSKEILNRNVEKGYIPKAMKKRLLTSHFHYDNVVKFLKANELDEVHEIRLIHLSDGNSNAKQFKEEVEKLTGIPTIIC